MTKLFYAAALSLLALSARAQDMTSITISSPEKVRAGEPFAIQVTVRDARGLTDASRSGPITMSARMRGLAAEGTLSVTSALLDKGRAVVAQQSFTKAGIIRIAVADYNGLTGESGNIEILPNDAASLSLSEEKYGGKTYAAAIARDIYSNPVKGLRVDFSTLGKFLPDPKWAFTDERGRALCAVYGSGQAALTAASGKLSAAAKITASPVPEKAQAQQFAETQVQSEEPAFTEMSPAQAEREEANAAAPTVAPVTDFVHPALVPSRQEAAAQPPAEPAETQISTPPASSLRVLRHTLASGLKDKNPEGENPSFSGQTVAVYWNQVASPAVPFTLLHRWFHEGKMVAEIKAVLSVSPARTWSKKTVRPGAWEVQALDENGIVLSRTEFTVAP